MNGLVFVCGVGVLAFAAATCLSPKPKKSDPNDPELFSLDTWRGHTKGGLVQKPECPKMGSIHRGHVIEHWTSTSGSRVKDGEIALHSAEMVVPAVYGTTRVLLGTKNLERKTLRCKHCGVQINPDAPKCVNCGAPQ